MKISVNAIRAFNAKYGCAGDPAPDGVDKLVERIGAQLAAVEETVEIGKKYQGIIVVKVIEAHKHENSDHLNVCKIDDGGAVKDVERDSDGYVQVVCGAPNVRTGLTVAWLPPGSTVPSSFDDEPFVLSVREIRGEVSNGMLASPKELALGDNHDGILEIERQIDGDIAPGTSFADHFGLTDDVVIDMENKMFTHRPDCFGMLGIAREIAGIQGQKFTSPDWYKADAIIAVPEQAGLKIEVRNEIPELVPRFAAVPLSGITIKPSPVWLQVELARLGVRPINNVVDLTNYHMLLTGQPLHAYDYDKVVAQDDGAEQATIVIRQPHKDEKLTLLNGKTIEPRPEAIIIASEMKAIGLGGVMGGADTEVDDATTNIILECASFDMYSIRRTSMAHGIFTDAVTRFNKGQSPLQNMAVLAHIVEDMRTIASGTVAGPVVDDNHVSDEVKTLQSLHTPDTIAVDFINQRLGLKLADYEIIALLENVEFHAHDMGGMDEVCFTAPFWRTDIEIPEDIVEEVGRLYGFDQLPLELPKRDLTAATKNPMFELKQEIRNKLSRAGANELLTYSFVHGNLLDKVGQDRELAFRLSNALSPDLQYYRLSLTPSLLDKIHANIKAGYDEFALFEIGKAHINDPAHTGLPYELQRVALVYAANDKTAQAYDGAPFYQARNYLMEVLQLCGIADMVTFQPLDPEAYHGVTKTKISQYATGRSATIVLGNVCVGEIGEYNPAVRKALKLPDFTAGFELDMAVLSQGISEYTPVSRFPKVWQDICLRVPSSVGYQELHSFISNELQQYKPENSWQSLAPVDIYQRPDEPDYKQVTFRFTTVSYDKTMTDAEVSPMLDAVAAKAGAEFGAERV